MADFKQLNSDLAALVEKRAFLDSLNYNDDNYDEVEDDLHDIEDSFIENYGDALEDIFMDAHDNINTDSDVLLPTAYIPKKYKTNNEDNSFEIDQNDGVIIESDDLPDQDTRLVLVPEPARILYIVNGQLKDTLWSSENSLVS